MGTSNWWMNDRIANGREMGEIHCRGGCSIVMCRRMRDKMHGMYGENRSEKRSHTVQEIEGDEYIARLKHSYLQTWSSRVFVG